MPPVHIPYLATLNRPASWLNAKGNLDRSACIEIRVAEIRRRFGCSPVHHSRRGTTWRIAHATLKMPKEVPAPTVHGRVCSGIFDINFHDVIAMLDHRKPRRLAGDFRTPRAPAMRHPTWREDQPFTCRVTRSDPVAHPPDRGLDANPNMGAARTKLIGIPDDWSQPVRMEKWVFPNRIRPAYYFICPGHSMRVHHRDHRERREGRKSARRGTSSPGPFRPSSPQGLISGGGAGGGAGGGGRPRSELKSVQQRYARALAKLSREERDFFPGFVSPELDHLVLQQPPPLSNCGPGRKNPSTKKCPQRCLKLMLVQCTREELRDAMTADLWINSLPPQLVPQHREAIAKLMQRYGPIMPPRVLLCPRCLGVKYGNHPETVRQGWRRRNNKPDVTVESSLITPRAAERAAQVDPADCTKEAGEQEMKLARKARLARNKELLKQKKERQAYYDTHGPIHLMTPAARARAMREAAKGKSV